MKPGVFREEYIAIIVRELLKGLEYLHSEGKLHRDIKGAPTRLGASRARSDFNFSGKYSVVCKRGSKVSGLRCLGAVVRYTFGQEEHLCWDPVLDVAGGDQAEWIRPQG